MRYRLRRARDTDAEEITELLRILRTESPEYEYVDDDPEFVAGNLERLFMSDVMQGVVAEDANGIVGFMIGFISSPWYSKRVEAMEQLLYVHPDYRGSTVAPRLIRQFEDVCACMGAEELTVGASTGMAESRTVALYERMGYTKGSPTLKKVL